MTHRISRLILAHNAGRDPARLALKFARLRQDVFSFFRGTNHLFLDLLPRSNSLWRAPRLHVCGDLHLENFGTYKGDNRLCYFDINDFDEACLAPVSIDIVRFLTSLYAASAALRWTARQRDSLARCFLDAYCAAILDGKPRWVERSLAEGAVRLLLKRAAARTRIQLLDRYTDQRGGGRRLRLDDQRLFRSPARERPALRRVLASATTRHLVDSSPRFFRLLDVAHRAAGNASLGLARYALLIEGRGSPQGNFILDLKAADASVVARWSRLTQPADADEARRIVRVQRLLQAVAPAMLATARIGRAPFVLKELQPSLDRLDLADLGRRNRRLKRALSTMGAVSAWAHLRGAGHQGAAGTEGLQQFVRSRGWQRQAISLARSSFQGLLRAWKQYAADYDAGRIVD